MSFTAPSYDGVGGCNWNSDNSRTVHDSLLASLVMCDVSVDMQIWCCLVMMSSVIFALFEVLNCSLLVFFKCRMIR